MNKLDNFKYLILFLGFIFYSFAVGGIMFLFLFGDPKSNKEKHLFLLYLIFLFILFFLGGIIASQPQESQASTQNSSRLTMWSATAVCKVGTVKWQIEIGRWDCSFTG